MENTESKATQKLRGIVNNMIERDIEEWPPECFLFAYQPIRPQTRTNEVTDKKPE